MTEQTFLSGPVVAGGVGGSGTRLIALMLIQLGYYMGGDINRSSDNQWFNLLFRRPHWLTRVEDKNPADINRAIRMFEDAMMGRLTIRGAELKRLIASSAELALQPREGSFYLLNWVWALGRIISLSRSGKVELSRYRGWGWKEPNTHVFLRPLSAYFPKMKYIHVIRHGLDMAYSDNQLQIYNWGKRYGVSLPEEARLWPKASVEYWIKANQTAIREGQTCLGERFMLIHFERFCASPEEGIRELLAFLEINPQTVDMAALCSLPKVPKSVGRYQKQDLSIFTQEQIDAVRELGFEVDR